MYIIVGVGGTGSYALKNIIQYLNGKKTRSKIVLIDGDVLEEKNLTRQGFLQRDLNKNKAEALGERFNKVVPVQVTLEYYTSFIETVEDIEKHCTGNVRRIHLISCVDNNMARFRMIMTQHKLHHDLNKQVSFIDAGNSEYTGQTLLSVLKKDVPPTINFEYGKERVGMTYKEQEGHLISTIFDNDENWKDNLTVGDHEMSCEVNVESSPQNILTNMTSATCIVQMLHKVTTNDLTENMRIQFNTTVSTIEKMKVKENKDRIKEIVEYANNEGYEQLFNGIVTEQIDTEKDSFEVGESVEDTDDNSNEHFEYEENSSEEINNETNVTGIDVLDNWIMEDDMEQDEINDILESENDWGL